MGDCGSGETVADGTQHMSQTSGDCSVRTDLRRVQCTYRLMRVQCTYRLTCVQCM